VFLVDSTANKRQIKAAVNQLYEIKAAKVRVGLGGEVERGCAVLMWEAPVSPHCALAVRWAPARAPPSGERRAAALVGVPAARWHC
jgi:hypothetical protein